MLPRSNPAQQCRSRILSSTRTVSAVVFITYVITARLGLLAAPVEGFATLIWPPSGIALAAIVLFGYRLFPFVFLAAFSVNLWEGAPVLAALGIGFGNASEAAVGAYLLKNVADFRPTLDRLRDALSLALYAAILSTLVSATIGTTALWLTGSLGPGTYNITWLAWWLGDMLGVLIIAPLVMVWRHPQSRNWTRSRHWVAEAALMLNSLAIVALITFEVWKIPEFTRFAKTYFVFPWLIWSAIRFGQHGTSLSTFLIAAVAIASTLAGHSAYSIEPASLGLLHLQTFLTIVALTGMALAAVSTELKAQKANLEEIVRTRTSQLVKANEEQKAAVRSREEILAVVSHDLNSPLTSIHTSISLLAKCVDTMPPEKRVLSHRLIEIIEGSTRQMRRLIADLLDLSSIRAGSFSLHKQEHPVESLVNELVETFRPVGLQKQIHIQVNARIPSQLSSVACDRERIFQVLSNIVGNAVKFSPVGGTITLEVEHLSKDLRISVTDEGPGISSEQLGLIFERFWRAKDKGKAGSGLGLYIAKGIVEAHGGRIWAESAPGRGSTFRFTLPQNS